RRVYDNEAGTQRNMNEARAALRRSRRKRGDLGEEKLADETLKQPELAHDLQARVARGEVEKPDGRRGAHRRERAPEGTEPASPQGRVGGRRGGGGRDGLRRAC